METTRTRTYCPDQIAATLCRCLQPPPYDRMPSERLPAKIQHPTGSRLIRYRDESAGAPPVHTTPTRSWPIQGTATGLAERTLDRYGRGPSSPQALLRELREHLCH